MGLNNKAKLIFDNKELFTPNNVEAAKIAIDISQKCIENVNYKLSQKQSFILNKAYEYLYPIVEAKKEKEKHFKSLSKVDQAWSKYSHTHWVDDEGPTSSMSYGQFKEFYNETRKEISSLQKKLKEALDKS